MKENSQTLIKFHQSKDSNEWYAYEQYNGIEIDFCVDALYFANNIIIWEHVELVTNQLLKDFDFIYEISKRWAIRLYNGYGNQLLEIDRFKKDGCEFNQMILVRLFESALKYDNAHHKLSNNLKFLVNNVFDSEFAYIDSSCLFEIFKQTHFVGVMGSSVQL